MAFPIVLGSDPRKNKYPEEPSLSPEEEVAKKEEDLYALAGAVAPAVPGEEKVITAEVFAKMAEGMGVDIEGYKFQEMLSAYGDSSSYKTAMDLLDIMSRSPEFLKQPLATPYNQALVSSGFGLDFEYPRPTMMQGQPAGLTPAQRMIPAPGTVTQPESGWVAYKNGVLVDVNSPNIESAVVFKPNSLAPGSYQWYQTVVSKWSPEKIAAERKHLVELGYLPKDYEDVKGIDEIFRMALTNYHVHRYYNGGKETAYDITATQPGKPTITAKDYQDRIRNNVRQQFMAVFGDEPSDAELDSWTRFTITQAVDLQREYIHRGASEGEALSAGMTEAAETTARRFWEAPSAEYQREKTTENTKLHDAIQRAITATEGLL